MCGRVGCYSYIRRAANGGQDLPGGGGSNLKEQCLTKPAVSQTYTDFQLFVLRRLSALYGFFYGLGASSALLSSLWESGVGERLSMGLSRGKPVVNRI
jgi:hypothetical protein